MKNWSDHDKIAVNSSLLIAIFTGIILLIYRQTSIPVYSIWFVIVTSFLVLVFSFLLIRYSVSKFITNKIKIIYKTIRTSKYPKGMGKTPFNVSLDSVNREVVEWSDHKKREIEELKKMADYRREFLGNVSHELKTPIFNIQGYVLTLLDGGLEDETINKNYLLRAEKSINRMIAIVEDLEKISQLEAGELQLDYSKFDIVSLSKEVSELLEMKIKEKEISISFAQSYDRPYYVYADKERIKEVLINLIDNSVKYGNVSEGKTKLSFFEMENSILVEVTDNGPGIEVSEIPRIFERFYRVDKARSRKQGGSGLGLAIVKHIIEAHDETINVRSSPGVGTTFAFTLKKAQKL